MRVGGHPAVDVRESVEGAHCGEPSIDGRGSKAPLLQRGAGQLDVGTGGFEEVHVGVSGPLEEGAQVVPVGVERPSAVSGQEGRCGHLGLSELIGLGEEGGQSSR